MSVEPRLITRANVTIGRTFKPYRKIGTTMLTRMTGPFVCETRDGNRASCDDGWIGIDAEGYPYPVAASVQAKAYALVEPARPIPPGENGAE